EHRNAHPHRHAPTRLADPRAGARRGAPARGDRPRGRGARLPLRRPDAQRTRHPGAALRAGAQLRDARRRRHRAAGPVRPLPHLPQDRARDAPRCARRRAGEPGGRGGAARAAGVEEHQPQHRHDPDAGVGPQPAPARRALARGDRRGCRDDARGGGERLLEDPRRAAPLRDHHPGRPGGRRGPADDPLALPDRRDAPGRARGAGGGAGGAARRGPGGCAHPGGPRARAG
ncbi:MAG: DNA polymerase III delta prime subunit, partial [uncultured Thermomicrobiales bacterium]